jgi:cyanate permease
MGFMAGLTMGGFLTGLVADVTGGYETAWASLLVLSILATLLALRSTNQQGLSPTV